MWSCRLLGTRARARQPASAMEANMCVAVSQSTRLCSMSTVSQAKPARAMKRAAVMLPSDSQVPTAGCPSFNARLTGLGRIIHPYYGVRRLGSVVTVTPAGRWWFPGTFPGGGRTVVTRWIIALKVEVIVVVIVWIFIDSWRLGPVLTGISGRVTHEQTSSRNTCFRKTPGEQQPAQLHPGGRFSGHECYYTNQGRGFTAVF